MSKDKELLHNLLEKAEFYLLYDSGPLHEFCITAGVSYLTFYEVIYKEKKFKLSIFKSTNPYRDPYISIDLPSIENASVPQTIEYEYSVELDNLACKSLRRTKEKIIQEFLQL